MNYGKDICKQLKAIRRGIAEQNGIALPEHNCTFKGNCSGTCPHCDAELRYLEEEMDHRRRFGRVVVAAGVAFILSATGSAVAQSVDTSNSSSPVGAHQTVDTVKLCGVVNGASRDMPVVQANVLLLFQDSIVVTTVSDIDGTFSLYAPKGEYEVQVSYFGHETITIPVSLDSGTVTLPVITMKPGYTVTSNHISVMVGGIGSDIVIESKEMHTIWPKTYNHQDSFGMAVTIGSDDINHMPTP